MVILSLPPELWSKRRERGETRTGERDKDGDSQEGGVEGRERRPRLEVVAGDLSTVTVPLEQGDLFKLDPLRVVFSPGNVHGRGRLKLVRPG